MKYIGRLFKLIVNSPISKCIRSLISRKGASRLKNLISMKHCSIDVHGGAAATAVVVAVSFPPRWTTGFVLFEEELSILSDEGKRFFYFGSVKILKSHKRFSREN